MAQPDTALPLLQRAHEAAKDKEMKVRCAMALAFLGSRAGVPTLIAELDSARGFDQGYHYASWGGTRSSRLDGVILALGRSGDRRAVQPILQMIQALDKQGDFSHLRAIALALEALGDPAAAAPLSFAIAEEGAGLSHVRTRHPNAR